MSDVTDHSTDEALMEAYRDGDVNAFDILFSRYKDMLYRYLVRQSGNASLAEEMFQETWAGVIKRREKYRVTASFKTYLFHIAHNKLIDYYRSSARHDAEPFDEETTERGTDAATALDIQVDTGRKVERLLQLLTKLPAEQRDVFLMHEEAGMTLIEVADIMQVTRDTVKSRLRYALQRLRKGMQRYE